MGDGTGAVPVKIHFIAERSDSDHIPWELVSDASHSLLDCDEENAYPVNEDIDSFLNGYWELPIDPKTVEYGKRFEIKGEGCIVFSRCGEYGCDIDADYEGTLTMEPTDKEECEDSDGHCAEVSPEIEPT